MDSMPLGGMEGRLEGQALHTRVTPCARGVRPKWSDLCPAPPSGVGPTVTGARRASACQTRQRAHHNEPHTCVVFSVSRRVPHLHSCTVQWTPRLVWIGCDVLCRCGMPVWCARCMPNIPGGGLPMPHRAWHVDQGSIPLCCSLCYPSWSGRGLPDNEPVIHLNPNSNN